MNVKKMKLWDSPPGKADETPYLTAYIPEKKTHDGAVVIFPGGCYYIRAEHEGRGYAEFLAEHGITAFVCDYRVNPHLFPLPLLDARRAVRTVRALSDEYGIDKNKIAVMGSSAGGHLAAMTSVYTEKIDFEGVDAVDSEDFLPNAQILCYPVIKLSGEGAHIGSGDALFGGECPEMRERLTLNRLVTENTPQAFIWHTFNDDCVDILNSIDYMRALRDNGIPTECHIYPKGSHGLGLALGDDVEQKHICSWGGLLIKWIEYIGF